MEQDYRDFQRKSYTQDSGRSVSRSPAEIERRREIRKKRRRRVLLRRILAVIIMLSLLGGIVAGVFVLKKKGISLTRKTEGTFNRNVDVTATIASDIAIWLSDIDGIDIDEKWVSDRIEPYVINETLTLIAGNIGESVYTRTIDQQSYELLTQTVNSDMDMLLGEIVKEKLIGSGYGDSVSDEEASQITREVLGMNASEYLLSNGVQIVPTIEELTEEVLGDAGGQSGSYSVSGNEMTISINGEQITETIIKKKGVLVFTNSGRVYEEK